MSLLAYLKDYIVKDHITLLQYINVVVGFVFYSALFIWAFWPTRKKELQEQASMIFHDDN